jgi:hypothetical protein
MECRGNVRMGPPHIDILASNQASGPATCFQISTPTADEGDCHFIGTPTAESFKIKDDDVDECFECDSGDDRSRVSDDGDSESEAETEASSSSAPNAVAMSKKLSWGDVAERGTRVCSTSPPVVEPQEPNWKLEAACHLVGRKRLEAGLDSDDDDSDDVSDDELLGHSRRDNLDDDFEVGSLGSDSEGEL